MKVLHKYNLVVIAMANDLHKIKSTATKQKWIHNLLVVMSGGGSTIQDEKNTLATTLIHLLSYFATSDLYSDVWDDVVKENGDPLPKIDKIGNKAIQGMCNMNMKQMKIVCSCFAHGTR